MKKSLLIAALIICTNYSFAQQRQKVYIGLSVTPELVSLGNGLRTGVGTTLDVKFNKNIGIETGAFLRTYEKTFAGTTGGQFLQVDVVDYHISVPVLFKYYNKIINISGGPSLDFYSGYKQTNHKDRVTIPYSPSEKINFGLQGKLGKAIKLSPNLVFEPEGRFAYIFPTVRSYLGLGLALKYGL